VTSQPKFTFSPLCLCRYRNVRKQTPTMQTKYRIEILCSVQWQFRTDVSEPIGPIFKGQPDYTTSNPIRLQFSVLTSMSCNFYIFFPWLDNNKGRRGRRRKQLLDDLKENRRYWRLKEEALDRTLWRTRFGRSYGPVVRQTAE
jgi:hypothetical protein